jgi:L-rhamnose 1-dehydrogenase
MLLENKVVLITGASRGIGRATAVEAARQGANVALNTFRDDAVAAEVVAEIEALGRQAIVVDADVALPDSATTFVNTAVKAFGRVDVFVSNAGICPFHAFLDMPVETLQRTMEVNLHGAYFMTQAAANQMVKQGEGGAIVAISSISALVGGEMQTHYTPTKAGVHMAAYMSGAALLVDGGAFANFQ